MRSPISELVSRRYSCRAYVDQPIDDAVQRELEAFLATLDPGPLGSRVRVSLVAATADDRASLKGLGTYGFIKDAPGFLVGAAERAPKDLEDYGYSLEHAVLAATDLGLQTCWLGGTFSKSSFARKIGATRDDIVPAVAAVGYPTEGSKKAWARQKAGSHHRLPPEQLFFDGTFEQPLEPAGAGVGGASAGVGGAAGAGAAGTAAGTRAAAGTHAAATAAPNTDPGAAAFAPVLDALRWAPSASNKQPWRILRRGETWHFYLQRTKGYGKGTATFALLRLADLQRVDMGIAMCHFDLVARERGLSGGWVVDPPAPGETGEGGRAGLEYVASWAPPGE